MSKEQPDVRALKREWTIGLAVIVGGFIIAIAVAAWLTFGQKPAAPTPGETQTEETAPASQAAAQPDPTQICSTALANAENFGIIPSFGRLTNPNPRQTKQRGRYVCDAATDSAKYAITLELVCKDFADTQCVSLYTIAQDDGTVLYQRQQ
jgi:hypothetical protein